MYYFRDWNHIIISHKYVFHQNAKYLGKSIVSSIVGKYGDSNGMNMNNLQVTSEYLSYSPKEAENGHLAVIPSDTYLREDNKVSKRQVNDHIPPQFRYPEYQLLDRRLTDRYGLPF